jgi:hypothetical protein
VVNIATATVLVGLSRPLVVLIAVTIGMIIYMGALGLTRHLCRLPQGGESILLNFVRQRIARILACGAT